MIRHLRVVRRLLVRLVVLVVGLAVLGAIYQAAGSAIDSHLHTAPGQMVDVGGYRLHLYCTGHGSPTVVMDAGLTGSYRSWSGIQPAVARETRVCSYDRAGYGWSDGGPLPRTSGRIVSELHALLRRGGVRPPYVLVGQSFGGMNVRLYAYRYTHDVAGMVLVDSSVEDQFTHGKGAAGGLLLVPCQVAVTLGIPSIASQIGLLPKPETGSFYHSGLCSAVFGEIASEDRSAAEVRAARHALGRMPLIVLTRDLSLLPPSQAAFRHFWTTHQDSLARLSSNSKHIVVKGSGHNIQTDRPAVVIRSIERVIQAVRHGGRV